MGHLRLGVSLILTIESLQLSVSGKANMTSSCLEGAQLCEAMLDAAQLLGGSCIRDRRVLVRMLFLGELARVKKWNEPRCIYLLWELEERNQALGLFRPTKQFEAR